MCSAVPCAVLSSFSSYWWWLLRGILPNLLSPSQPARTPICMPCQGPPVRCVRAPSRSPGTLIALSQAPARTGAAQLRRRGRMASAAVMGTTTQTLMFAKLGSALAPRCSHSHSHSRSQIQIRSQIHRHPRMTIMWHRSLRPRRRRLQRQKRWARSGPPPPAPATPTRRSPRARPR